MTEQYNLAAFFVEQNEVISEGASSLQSTSLVFQEYLSPALQQLMQENISVISK